MFCENCGTQNPNGARFCRKCGAMMPVAAPQPVAAPVGAPQPAAAPQPAQGGYAPQPGMAAPMSPMNPVRALLRELGTGPLFLTGAVSYTAALLFQLISAFMPDGGLGGMVFTIMNLLPSDVMASASDYGIDITETVDAMQAGSFVNILFSTLFTMLPAILIAVSIWLIFVGVRDTTGKPIGTAGFTIIKVLNIIGIVGEVMLLIFVEIVLAVFTYSMSQYSSDSSDMVGFFIMMAIVAVAFALAILYNVQLVRTLSTMSNTAVTLVPSSKVSVYVAIINFLGIPALLISLIFFGGVFGRLNTLCLIVAQISFSIFLLSYRGRMKTLSGGM